MMSTLLFVAPGVALIGWTYGDLQRLIPADGLRFIEFFPRSRLFHLARRFPSLLSVVGPLSVLMVFGIWTLLLTAGFALIYTGFFPACFTGPQPPIAQGHSFITLFAFSLSQLSTLGTPDLAPKTDLLRLTPGTESLLGFSLVTASISWIVLIYPALGRTRTLARRAADLVRAEQLAGVKAIRTEPDYMLADFSHHVIRLRVDLIHFPLIYYFHADVERAALPQAIMILHGMAEAAQAPECPPHVRLAAASLHFSLCDLADVLARRFVKCHSHDPAAVFQAVARDHLTKA